MEHEHSSELRIPVRPQRWLFLLNLIVQPTMCALFVVLTLNSEGAAEALFCGTIALITLLLFGFSVLVVARTWGRTFELVVGERVDIPNPVWGRSERVALSAIRRGWVTETRARGVSFYTLTLEITGDSRPRTIVVSSQIVGPAAFAAFREALIARGVEIA